MVLMTLMVLIWFLWFLKHYNKLYNKLIILQKKAPILLGLPKKVEVLQLVNI